MIQNKTYELVEILNLLKISRSTMWRRMKSGQIPHHRFSNKILFTDDDLERILKDCEIKSSAGGTV